MQNNEGGPFGALIVRDRLSPASGSRQLGSVSLFLPLAFVLLTFSIVHRDIVEVSSRIASAEGSVESSLCAQLE